MLPEPVAEAFHGLDFALRRRIGFSGAPDGFKVRFALVSLMRMVNSSSLAESSRFSLAIPSGRENYAPFRDVG